MLGRIERDGKLLPDGTSIDRFIATFDGGELAGESLYTLDLPITINRLVSLECCASIEQNDQVIHTSLEGLVNYTDCKGFNLAIFDGKLLIIPQWNTGADKSAPLFDSSAQFTLTVEYV